MTRIDSTPQNLPATQRSIPIAMLRARETLMAPIRSILLAAGVTEQQWRVLRVLEESGQMDPKVLAARACLLNPSLTRIMQHLEKSDLIKRKADPKDGRKMLIDITRDGTALLRRTMPQNDAVFKLLEERFGRDQMDQLLDLLNALSEIDLES